MAEPAGPTAAPAPAGWHRYTTADQPPGDPGGVIAYGAELPTEADLRLLGTLEGARILDLGCGTGRNAVALAQLGAKVIAVDPSAERLAAARERADAAEVRVELHQAELADLAFLRSDSVDAALSAMALAEVDDLARVFRQVHRVLKREGPLVASVPHPAFAMLDPGGDDPLRIARAYDDPSPHRWELDGTDVVDHPRTFSLLFTTFARAGLRIDQVIEPVAGGASRDPSFAEAMRAVPATLLLRARKQGD
jgi:SAM-dependent methyltransferase